MLPARLAQLQRSRQRLPLSVAVYAALLLTLAGCGATRTTDSGRTATEQLLISDAIDRAVDSVNLQVLAGQSVFLDSTLLGGVTDRDYLIGSVRQQLLANGCVLKTNRNEADYVVEVRAGAVGTDRNDLLFGIPAVTIPSIVPLSPGVPSAIPEIPFVKRSQQRGVAKIALFAYRRESGNPVWQSGLAMQQSSSSDIWVFGAGPFQKGSIYDGTKLAGDDLVNPLMVASSDDEEREPVSLAAEAVFEWPELPESSIAEKDATVTDKNVQPAIHEKQPKSGEAL